MRRGLLGLVIAALALLPSFGEPYVLHVAIVVLIHVVYAQALYVIMRMGYLSFGHAGYIALGGYTSALLATKLGISPWIGSWWDAAQTAAPAPATALKASGGAAIGVFTTTQSPKAGV